MRGFQFVVAILLATVVALGCQKASEPVRFSDSYGCSNEECRCTVCECDSCDCVLKD